MRLSEVVKQVDGCQMICSGDFMCLEQCSRVRCANALVYIESPAYIDTLDNADITCVICTPELLPLMPPHIKGIAVAEDPKRAFYQFHNHLIMKEEKTPTLIDPSANISPLAYIAPHNIVIGKNVEIQPFSVVHENSTLKDNVRICSGSIIGGKSFNPVHDGPEQAFFALDGGQVLLEEGVEICSHSHVACGILKNDITILGAYTKVDAMVHIGHGTVIGRQTRIAAGAAISGNCIIGSRVWIGVNATISNRIRVGDNARISLGAVVTKDVPEGITVSGNFAIEHQRFLKNLKASIK